MLVDLGIESLCIGIVCGGVVSGVAIVGICVYQAFIEWNEDRNYGICGQISSEEDRDGN